MPAPATPQPSSTFEIARPAGLCAVCGQQIPPQTRFMAALVETPAGFARTEACAGCWERFDRKDALAFWQTTLPKVEPKKKVFVDDAVLCDLFARLADVSEPAKLNFRFVLGLILMRKRLIVYESTRRDGDTETWTVRLRGRDESLPLVNPRLGEDEIRQVSGQLSEILSQEL